MIWQENPYTIPLMIASLVSIVLGVYLGFRRRNLGDIMGMVLILANTECIFAYAFELASADLDTKIFWNNMQFIGLAIIPTVWMMYALWYTGRKNWLTRRIVAGLTIVPGITLVLTFTNEHHKLMCSAAYLLTNYPFLVLEKTYGPLFWVYVVYSYVLIIFALLMLVHMLIHSRSFYRWQASALLCGAVIPWAAATLFVSDANPLPYLNLIPVAFVVTNIMVSFSITYLRLGDVVPLAWETIIENMGDSVIVLDEESRILDINISAQNILGACIGESVDTLPGWFNNGRPGNTEDKEIVLDHKNEKRTYDVRISPLVDWRGYAVSRVVVLRDITERKRAEEKVRQSLKEKEVLLKEIHHRVKNNMQIISSLLSLQSHYSTDKPYRDMLKESQDRIKSMALIHEKLYQSENLAEINFKEYIKTLVHGLIRSYRANIGSVSVILDVEDVFLDIGTAIPCGLTINELVSNALKHAFPDGKGEIAIALRSVGDSCELVIRDNGVGIPDTVDITHTQSLGLRLVTLLTEDQLEGDLTLDRQKGTTFYITFKK